MSHFLYGKPARRHLRKGVWLRVLSLPKNILSLIGELKCANELIEWVVVVGQRYTVFHLLVQENPEWICEGDLGRGYK